MTTFPSDAFVALPPSSARGHTVFAKNSGRPSNEVQEVLYIPASDHASSSKVKCTYIEIDQALHTWAVLLSKPSWMWGAEMGANEHGVCIGNTGSVTKLSGPEDVEEKLLGQDLVRLGLERASSSKEAVDIITALIEAHGQGGNIQEDPSSQVTHHSHFLIADHKEAWVLETVGRAWAVELVSAGIRNISNCLSIHTKMDTSGGGLTELAQSKSLWQPGDGDLDFAKVFSSDSPTDRFDAVKNFIEGDPESVDIALAMKCLRDETNGINQGTNTTASMISVLTSPDSNIPSVHFFTATPNPNHSVFKPFIFTKTASQFPEYTISPTNSSGGSDDKKHRLYVAHERACATFRAGGVKACELKQIMSSLEEEAIRGIDDILGGEVITDSEVDGLFLDCVETEIKFYK